MEKKSRVTPGKHQDGRVPLELPSGTSESSVQITARKEKTTSAAKEPHTTRQRLELEASARSPPIVGAVVTLDFPLGR